MVFGQLKPQSSTDSILTHQIVRNSEGMIIPWYESAIPGSGYGEVCRLAAEFMLKSVPIDSKTGLPLYLVTCCFHQNNDGNIIGEEWPHNPACAYAGAVQSFALDYYSFSGDSRYIELVRSMLDYQLANGTTPDSFSWPQVPYASSDPFEKEYVGATRWESDASRGDGLHVIEPDKVGELGVGYLKFYQLTNDKKYLDAGLNCARALAKNVRNIQSKDSPFDMFAVTKSPWPFRVNARTGVVISEYCSNALDPIRLFDEVLKLRVIAGIDDSLANNCTNARRIALDWLFSKDGPMHTYIWNAYFEDIPNDPLLSNRNQLTPGEVAKYIIRNPDVSKSPAKDVSALIHWISSVFKTENMDAIKEQTWCFEPMGSHTSRYGAVCAMWYEYSGEEYFKDQAARFLNVATYMTSKDGYVAVGPNWPGAWWSDGYSDYVRHFFDAMAAIPEWSPRGENHVLRSSSVVQNIQYKNEGIALTTFDSSGSIVCSLVKKPKQVLVYGKAVQPTWRPFKQGGGALTFSYSNGSNLEIKF